MLEKMYDFKKDKFTSWNPVIDLVTELKYRYFGYFGKFDYSKSNNIVRYWSDKLAEVGILKYQDILKFVKIVQYEDLVLFKYDTLAAYNSDEVISLDDFWNMYNGFYRECRGIVINILRDDIVCAPYSKFFNINELEETSYDNIVSYIKDNNIPDSMVEFTEKLDGSLISATWYDGKIVVSASGSLDPKESPVIKWAKHYILHSQSHREMIRFNDNGMGTSNSRFTYIFECICPVVPHVVTYNKDQYGMYLIGIRDTISGHVDNYWHVKAVAEYWNIPATHIYDGYTLDYVMSKLDDKVGSTHEGFVMNMNGFRVKIKYTDYVQLHHIVYGISVNSVIRAIYDNSLDDIKSMLRTRNCVEGLDLIHNTESIVREYLSQFEHIANKYYEHISKMIQNESSIKDIMDFINTVQPSFIRSKLRNMYKGMDTSEKILEELTKPASRVPGGDLGFFTISEIKERLEKINNVLEGGQL